MTELTAQEHLLMEAAQCVWEHILDQTRSTDRQCANPWWNLQRRNHGMSALRHWARALAPTILEAYDLAMQGRAELGMAYDIDFIPWFVDNLATEKDITWELRPALHPEWKTYLRYHFWRKDLDDYVENRFGLDGSEVKSDANAIREAFLQGADWREIADQAAEKFGWEELPTYRPAVVVGHAK